MIRFQNYNKQKTITLLIYCLYDPPGLLKIIKNYNLNDLSKKKPSILWDYCLCTNMMMLLKLQFDRKIGLY